MSGPLGNSSRKDAQQALGGSSIASMSASASEGGGAGAGVDDDADAHDAPQFPE